MFIRKFIVGVTLATLATTAASCHKPAGEEQPSPPATSTSEAPDYAPVPIYIPNGSGGSTLLFI